MATKGFWCVPRTAADALLSGRDPSDRVDVRVWLAMLDATKKRAGARRDDAYSELDPARITREIAETAGLGYRSTREAIGRLRARELGRLDAVERDKWRSRLSTPSRGRYSIPIPRGILRELATLPGAAAAVGLAVLEQTCRNEKRGPLGHHWRGDARPIRMAEIAERAGVSKRQAQRIVGGFDWLVRGTSRRGEGLRVTVDPIFGVSPDVTPTGDDLGCAPSADRAPRRGESVTPDVTPTGGIRLRDVTHNVTPTGDAGSAAYIHTRDTHARGISLSSREKPEPCIAPERRARGARSSPDLDRITAGDLADPDRLGTLERAGVDRGEWTFDPTCAATEAERVLRQHRAGLVSNPGAAWRAARKRRVRWGSIRDEERAEQTALRIKGAPQRRETAFDRSLGFEDRRRQLIDDLYASEAARKAGGAA